MTAATFAMSSPRNRVLNLHSEKTAAVARPKKDFVALLPLVWR